MQCAALISQGVLFTNMASLLQRCLSTTLHAGRATVAEGERNVDASVAAADTITPPPGLENVTIDLGEGVADEDDGDADKDDEESPPWILAINEEMRMMMMMMKVLP